MSHRWEFWLTEVRVASSLSPPTHGLAVEGQGGSWLWSQGQEVLPCPGAWRGARTSL